MQSKAPHVLRLGRGRRAAKERGEVLDPLHVVMLGLRCELADRHVFDHAPTQRADGLLGHGDAPVLSEVVETPQSQDRTLRPAMVLAVPPAAALYRASGLVPWPIAETAAIGRRVPRLGDCGHQNKRPRQPPPLRFLPSPENEVAPPPP